MYRVNGKRRLTPEQERRRLAGLRIIARHYLANPHLYPNAAAGDGRAPGGGEPSREEGAA